MESTKEVSAKYTLILNEKEAMWLRDNMQNPLQRQTLSEESPHDAEMRARFFYAIQTPQEVSKNG